MRVFIPLAATTAFAFNYGQPNQPFGLEEPRALKAAPGRFNSPDAFAALNVYSPYYAADETRGLTTAGRQGARPYATKADQPNRLLTRYYRGNYGHSARRFSRAAGRFAAGGLQGAVESDVGGKAGKRFAGRYETSGRRIGGKVGGVVGEPWAELQVAWQAERWGLWQVQRVRHLVRQQAAPSAPLQEPREDAGLERGLAVRSAAKSTSSRPARALSLECEYFDKTINTDVMDHFTIHLT
ncbi:hypothetical protein Ae201684P_016000 [Aphanomyces euteiches]|nr:hypothetical protein Ae201684P_016000 [Aphanomyces euteiches]